MDWDNLLFSGSAFLAGLVLLQYGADAFIANTAVIARRLGVSETLIALLVVGVEWEELAVVLASLLQHTPALGLGNVLGSCIGNILGAFSLGLLAYGAPTEFDRTARIYAGAQFVFTSVFALIAYEELLNLSGGIFLLVSFFVYLFSVAEAIYEGFMVAPVVEVDGEEENGETEREDESGNANEEISTAPTDPDQHAQLHIAIYPSVLACHPTSSTTLLHKSPSPNPTLLANPDPLPLQSHQRHNASYHLIKLFLGLFCTTVSGFVLSQAATSLADTLHLSPMIFGLTILSLATTLPEKIISVLSGFRGRPRILVASTAGCNIFLLTLCLGIIFVSGGGDDGKDSVNEALEQKWAKEVITGDPMRKLRSFEIWYCWTSSLILVGVTWIGGKPWVGGLLLGLYGGFLGCELTVLRR